MKFYTLSGSEITEVDVAEWFESDDRIIAQDKVGNVLVSTVFLGIDHNFCNEGAPVLFETMVFGGPLDSEMERYCTRQEAEQGHARMLELVKDHNPLFRKF